MTRIFAILATLSLAACGGPSTSTTKTTVISSGPVAVAEPNPASQNCLTLGGTVVLQSGPSGETGFCALPGGAVVEEWKLYRETRS